LVLVSLCFFFTAVALITQMGEQIILFKYPSL